MAWDWWTLRATRRTPGQRLVNEVATFVLVTTSMVVALVFGVHRLLHPSGEPPAHALGETTMIEDDFEARCGPASADPFIVTWVHTPELEPWLAPASTAFMRACPNTQVRLIAREDISAAKAIANGELAPTVWTPSDSAMLDYLEARVHRRASATLTELELERSASLVHTPVVLLIWNDRVAPLDRLVPAGLRGPGALARSTCAGIDEAAIAQTDALDERALVPARWDTLWRAAHPPPIELPREPSLAELDSWGRVRVRHASPTTAPLGLFALYLMAREHVDPAGLLDGPLLADAIHEHREQLEAWLRRCEAGLDAPLPTARLLTETMFNHGDPGADADGFDAVITDEHLAFAVLAKIDAHEGPLRDAEVVYPHASMVLDYPVAVFPGASDEVEGSALRFAGYLRSPELQRRALELGFRPVNPQVSIHDYDLGPNPFTQMRRHGVELELPSREVPRTEGAALLELVELWAAATGR